MKLVVLPLAELDLENVWLYTQETWGSEQADRYLGELYSMLRDLAEQPGLGHACDDLRPGYRRCRHDLHVIFYRMTVDAVEVVRVLHEKMDIESHL